MKFNFKRIKKLFSLTIVPKVNVAGVELTDSYVNYMNIVNDKIETSVSVKLEKGVVLQGKVIDKEKLSSALRELRKKIDSKNKDNSIILSISDANIFTQVVDLPYVAGHAAKESIFLNLEIASPIEINKTYYHWQYINNLDATSKKRVTASFIEKEIINDINDAFSSAGFLVVAIEQKSASLARILRLSESRKFENIAVFLLHIDSDGMSFSIVNSGDLVFNRFIYWEKIYKQENTREIKFSDFKRIILEESHKVVNYYANRFRTNPKFIYLMAEGMEDKIKNSLKEEFASEIITTSIKNHKVESSNLVAFGAALRGEIKRSKDDEISLAPEDTREKFRHEQVLSFIGLWREIFIVSFVVLLVAMLGTFIFLGNYMNNLVLNLEKLSKSQNTETLKALKEEAIEFNRNIDVAIETTSKQRQMNNLVSNIYDVSLSKKVEITRIYIQSQNSPISITAYAGSEQGAIDFKKELEDKKILNNVDLPLSAMEPVASGGVVFRLSANIPKQ